MAEQNAEGATVDPQLETKARSMGWVPESDFRGDKTKWLPAGEFVARGEQMIPIIKAENRRLHETVEGQNARIAAQDNQLKEFQASIEALKNFNTEISAERVKALRIDIARQIKEARESGDVERELELVDQKNAATEALESAGKPKKGAGTEAGIGTGTGTGTPASAPPIDPAWLTENPWFGSDEARSDLAMGVSQRLRAKFPNLFGRPFLNKLSEEVLKIMPLENPNRGNPSKVEGGSNGAGGGGAGNSGKKEKSYEDLPADAKSACDRYAKQLVGPNKVYKTEAEFRKHYVSQYDFS